MGVVGGIPLLQGSDRGILPAHLQLGRLEEAGDVLPQSSVLCAQLGVLEEGTTAAFICDTGT